MDAVEEDTDGSGEDERGAPCWAQRGGDVLASACL